MPPAYPAELESAVLLADGRVAEVRPIVPGDFERLRRFAGQLSPETIYFRFFTPRKKLRDAEVEHFVNVDYENRLALVALMDGELVAIARYDRPAGSDEAEVAFVVRDDQQGRGVGTVLLEHLASAAMARSIKRFVADTLAENSKMLNVLRRSGFEEHAAFESGVVRVRLELTPAQEYLGKVEERDRRAAVQSIARLLCPRAIAVVGASRRPHTIGHELLRNLTAGGFEGEIFPVNPAGGSIGGLGARRQVAELPDGVDLAFVAVPADSVTDVVEACGERQVGAVVVISAGFAETGENGRAAEQTVVSAARHHGMRLVGPNSMGIVNTAQTVRMNGTFSPVAPAPGRIAFSSQSGGLGVAILNEAAHRHLGISSFVSVGNKADVSSNDLVRYWEQDPETDVILLHLESFGNPRHFSTIARRVGRSKPMIAVKAGRSVAGSRGASSHTAAVASLDAAADALFRQAGVIRVDTIQEMFEVADVISHQPLPAGGGVAIVGNTGGPGVLAADACANYGLNVPEFSADTQQRLREVLSPQAAVSNPVDCAPAASGTEYSKALEIVLDDSAVDSVIVIFTPPLETHVDDVAEAVAGVAASATKPIVATFLATTGSIAALRQGTRRVPWFAYPEPAARALARIAGYARWRAAPEVAPPTYADIDAAAARQIVNKALESGTDDAWLDDEGAAALLGAYGIGVAIGAESGSAVPAVIGLVEDPTFGPLVSFGLGGPVTELLGDRALSLVPVSLPEAVNLIGSVRAAPLLAGGGGAEPADVGALAEVVCRVSRLAEDLPEVAEMTLNPVLASAGGCIVAGARVRLAPAVGAEPVLRRRHLR